jgi:septal ring factor EnvC (AmiA/AmiB activator)
MALDNIEKLESVIDQLLQRHERVRKEKASVEKKLQQRETEWHQLRGQLRQFERERTEIRQRLERILDHFERLKLT